MRKKQPVTVPRNKSARSSTRSSKRDRFKGQPAVDIFDAGSRCLDAEHCNRSRKKKNCFTVCHSNPTMDNRSRLALHTGSQYSRTNPTSCRRKADMNKHSYRSHYSVSPMNNCYASPGQSRREFKEHVPLSDSHSHKREIVGDIPSFPDDDCSVSFQPSKFKNQRSFLKGGDDMHKTDHDPFPTCGSRWSCSGKNDPTFYTYAPSLPTNRSFANIIAEYSQPRTRLDNLMGTTFDSGNASANSIGFRNQLYTPTNISRDASSFQTNYTSQPFNVPKSTYMSSTTRPRSAGGYKMPSKHFPDYRDDMSTIALNAVRNNLSNSNRTWSNDLLYNPSFERKSLPSQFDASGNNFVSDELETMMRSYRPRATSYDTSHQHGLTNRKYDSSWKSPLDIRYDTSYSHTTSSSSNPNAYDYSSRLADTSTYPNLAISKGAYTYDNMYPKPLSNMISNHLQSEKERLHKIANMIGKTTCNK